MGCFRGFGVYKIVHGVTFRSWGNNELEYGSNPQQPMKPEGKMNFLEAAGAQGTQGWGIGDREPSRDETPSLFSV